MVSSRKEVDIRRALETNCETLIVEEKNRSDIKQFVTKEVNDLWGKIKHIAGKTKKIAGKTKQIAEPTTRESFEMVAINIVNQSEGSTFMEKVS